MYTHRQLSTPQGHRSRSDLAPRVFNSEPRAVDRKGDWRLPPTEYQPVLRRYDLDPEYEQDENVLKAKAQLQSYSNTGKNNFLAMCKINQDFDGKLDGHATALAKYHRQTTESMNDYVTKSESELKHYVKEQEDIQRQQSELNQRQAKLTEAVVVNIRSSRKSHVDTMTQINVDGMNRHQQLFDDAVGFNQQFLSLSTSQYTNLQQRQQLETSLGSQRSTLQLVGYLTLNLFPVLRKGNLDGYNGPLKNPVTLSNLLSTKTFGSGKYGAGKLQDVVKPVHDLLSEYQTTFEHQWGVQDEIVAVWLRLGDRAATESRRAGLLQDAKTFLLAILEFMEEKGKLPIEFI